MELMGPAPAARAARRPVGFPVRAALPVVLWAAIVSAGAATARAQSVSLAQATVVVDAAEPSFVQYGARDLASYLTAVTGHAIQVRGVKPAPRARETAVVIGSRAAAALGIELTSAGDLGAEGFVLRTTTTRAGATAVVVAGQTPHGTNAGIATLIPLIKATRDAVSLDRSLDRRDIPAIPVRGIHLNGWPLNYPYAFRAWKEEDWKRFIDMAWAQRVNLFYLWPFMEIIPVPLSAEDEAYLQEVRRVVDYAQNQRGMEVWIMQSVNRIAVSDCGVKDPRLRTYWVMGTCQQDLNPGDPDQVAKILGRFEVFYKTVNNADGFCFIDSDPGGWPGSPLSDQVRVFHGARKLLDEHNIHGTGTKLIDWMWLGWGRHPTGAESGKSAVAFMEDTIRNFGANLAEPWELISGMSPYLDSAKAASSLGKTIYLQYGAIEMEPAFPSTNMGLDPVLKVFETVERYPGLKGVMGNNELALLQLPRTFYFFETAWNTASKSRSESDVLEALAARLYPDHAALVADAYRQLRENDPARIRDTLTALDALIAGGDAVRAGAIGRFLFPDRLVILRTLRAQLEIRAARQSLIQALRGTPTVAESGRLLEQYFDRLLAWNQETGWDEMIDIAIWRAPIYEGGPDLAEATARLQRVIAAGKPYASYAQFDDFFAPIATSLLKKYGRDSVMIGCVDPFKHVTIQGW